MTRKSSSGNAAGSHVQEGFLGEAINVAEEIEETVSSVVRM